MERHLWFTAIPLILLAVLAVLTVTLSNSRWRAFTCLFSGLFGFLLKFGPFGFTCAFRSMLRSGNFSDMRALIAVICFAALLIRAVPVSRVHPLLYPDAPRGAFGYARSPVGVSLLIGALLFGAGMQLGSGCASGTLVGMGSGSVKSWVVAVFFIAGATAGSSDALFHWWRSLPATSAPVVLRWYYVVTVLAALYLLALLGDFIRRRVHRSDDEMNLRTARALLTIGAEEDEAADRRCDVRGIAYKLVIHVLLAVCVAVFFLCNGSTIGVMGIFAHIGAQFLRIFGAKPQEWDFFVRNGGVVGNMLNSDIFVSDVSIMLGAAVAAIVRRNFGKNQEMSLGELVKGVFGGFMMGLGARMAYGCNIGSMLSGITSCSLHGFVWMACAITGSAVVVYTTMLIKHIREKRSEGGGYNELK